MAESGWKPTGTADVSAPDAAAMERALSAHEDDLAGVILRLAWRSGLKRDELRTLRWEQVDFAHRALHLPDRDAPLDEDTAETLRRWKQTLDRLSCGGEQVLISARTKKQITASAISNAAKAALKRAGMADIRLEDLRLDFIRRTRAERGDGCAMRSSGLSAQSYFARFGATRGETAAPTEENWDRLWRVLLNNRTGSAGIALWLSQQANLTEQEISSLTWEQVELDKGILHLDRGDTYMIREVIDVLRAEKLRRGAADDPHVLLMPGTGRSIHPSQLSMMLRELMIENGMGDVSIGELRRSAQAAQELERIRRYARDNGRVTRREAETVLGIRPGTAYVRLRKLVDDGELARTSRGYVPAERFVPREQWETAVLGQIAERGFTTIPQVMALLRISRIAARRLLQQMTKRGTLAAHGGNRRFLLPEQGSDADKT